ncbi:ROK family protein [Streptomyces achromogenes]|uniref:ROK family protein n=1 Tax=Streptomyces achromogenes TaxID=67255 RepID=UPI0027D7C251|nr:ROK family protein [Streptomyces achromogenes]
MVLDIGGTWFRSAVRNADGSLSGVMRVPAVNYLNHPGLSQAQLRQRLVDYVLGESHRLGGGSANAPLPVSISVGAAVNGHTGVILGSGPLWGPGSESFDLAKALSAARADVRWSVINDVTALAAYFASRSAYRHAKKISVLTISTGIACRTIEVANRRVPLHPLFGVQGEIGHMPIDFHAAGRVLDLPCDCGGPSHLNAYCSGRGIPRVMARLASALERPQWLDPALLQDPSLWAALLLEGLATSDPAATELLHSVVKPVAQSIVSLLTVDPEVTRIVVTGGVPQSLGHAYQDAVHRTLEKLGMYMIIDSDPRYFRTTVEFAGVDDSAGLLGAALAAKPLARPSVGHLLSHRTRRMDEQQSVTYDAVLTRGGAARALVRSLASLGAVRPVILADAAVSEIYGPDLVAELDAAGLRPLLRAVPSGESAKNWKALELILQTLESAEVSRRLHPVVALGGGAVLDAVGLAAGLYRRGVPYVRVPTSLVGLIDAGVGAKVAVNEFGHKNRLGLFYPPVNTILDVRFLRTLPHRFMVSGIAEAIKISVVADETLFGLLEFDSHRLSDPAFYQTEKGLEAVGRAADAMMSSLSGNLWERGLDRAVDFGHSVSSLIEMSGLSVTHGEAVAIDMALTLEVGRERGITPPDVVDRVICLIKAVGLPVYSASVTADQLFESLGETAAHRGGSQRFPLIQQVGHPPVFVSDVERNEVGEAWSRLSGHGE